MEPTNTFDSAEFYKRKRLREEVLAQQMEQRHASVSRAIRKANTDMLLDKTVGLLKWAIPVAAAYFMISNLFGAISPSSLHHSEPLTPQSPESPLLPTPNTSSALPVPSPLPPKA